MKRRRTQPANLPKPAGTIAVRMVEGLPVPVPPHPRQWLTIPEVAAALEVSLDTVYDWISIGKLVGEIGTRRRVRLARLGIGRQHRIYPDAVLNFLRATSLPPSLASAPAPETVLGDEERTERIEAARRELREMGVDC